VHWIAGDRNFKKIFGHERLSRFIRRAEFSGDVSGKLHRVIFAFIGDARVLVGIHKRVTTGRLS